LCWQLRGQADKRQVKGAKIALQHNIGIGGAVVVSLYKMGFPQKSRIQAVYTSGSIEKSFKSYAIFKEIEKALEANGENIVKKMKGVFCFRVKGGPDGKEGIWVVDVKSGKGSVKYGADPKGDCVITMSDSDLLKMMTGQLKPQQAFFQGKLKIAGNMGLAMKLQNLQTEMNKAKL